MLFFSTIVIVALLRAGTARQAPEGYELVLAGDVETNSPLDSLSPSPMDSSTSVVQDGSFEDSPSNWLALSDGISVDAAIIHDPSSAHSGASFGRLGAGTLTPADTLLTEQGKTYDIQFFHKALNASFVDVIWNDEVVGNIRTAVSTDWKFFRFTVVAKGDDHLAFYGGGGGWSLIDDVTVQF